MRDKLETFSGVSTCGEHGEFAFNAYRVGKVVVGRVCPACMNAGQLKAQEKNAVRDRNAAIKARTDRLTWAGVPIAFQECDMASYDMVNERATNIVKMVQAYLANFSRVLQARPVPGMIFTGVPGTGKTHLACAMIAALIDLGFSAAYVSAPQLLTAMEDARFSRHDLSATGLIARYAKPTFLVIDEYGAHDTRDSHYQALFSVIDARYQANLPTLLITNLPYQKEAKTSTGGPLEALIDDRLIERIRGTGGPLFAFDWPSQRRRPPGVATAQT